MRSESVLTLLAAALGIACSLPDEPLPEHADLGSAEGKSTEHLPLVETDPIIQPDPCGLPFSCSEGDFHPADRGYRAFAMALWDAGAFGD